MNEQGVFTRDKSFSLSQNGNNLFASYTLDQEIDGRRMQVGFRNSMEKKFAVGICAGLSIIVCSNMMFKGEFIEFRKHTNGLTYSELEALTSRAVVGILPQINQLAQWQDSLKGYEVVPAHFKILTYNCMKAGAFPPSKFAHFLSAHQEEKSLSHLDDLYTFHGGVTRLMRDNSLFSINSQNSALERVMNGYTQTIDKRN